MARLLGFLFVAVHVELQALSSVLWSHRETTCEPLTLPVCKQLGYNQTRAYPGAYLWNLRREEMMGYVTSYPEYKCSKDLVFFLCAIYYPVCFSNYDHVVLPCRSVCEAVKSDCQVLVEQFRFSWPTELNCNLLPDYASGVCIRPDNIVLEKHFKKSPIEKKAFLNVTCPRCLNPAVPKKFKDYKRAHYAVEAVFLSRTQSSDKTFRLKFRIKKVFKSGVVPIQPSTEIEIWTESPCECPLLTLGVTYYVIGKEDRSLTRLMLSGQAYVIRKTRTWREQMKKWKRKFTEILMRRQREEREEMNYDQGKIVHPDTLSTF